MHAEPAPHARSGPGAALLVTALALASVPAGASAQAPATATGVETRGVESITAVDLRQRVGILAHDSMRGRDTPSPELEETARWIAERFRSFGLQPGLGSQGYLQWYPLTVVEPGPPFRQRLTLEGPAGRTTLDAREEFVAAPTGQRTTASGPLRRWSPAEGTAAPADGILLVPVDRASVGSAFEGVRQALGDDGAAGAIFVVEGPDAFFQRVRGFFATRQISLGEPDALSKPVGLVRRQGLPEALVRELEGDLEGEAWTAELRTDATVRGRRAPNVIGWIEGSDPELRDEYVVFTAHMDHVGVGEPVEGDSIYNGADDDGSGTAAVLELAEAFAGGPAPRRSVIFMTVSGEEKGLFGSRWYSEHPVFPLDRTVAALNMDMIGRNWKDTVVAVGKQESSLGATVDSVTAAHPELDMTVVEDRWPEQNFYRRSDHYNFARKGVPILFFFSGVHEDYHQPSDEVDRLDYDKTARIVRLVYLLGRSVADADEPPRWDPEAYERVVEEGGGR